MVAVGWKAYQKEYGRLATNLLLVLALFLLVIRPIIKTVREIKTTVEQEALPAPEDMALVEEEEKELKFIEMDGSQQKEYIELMTTDQKEDFVRTMSPKERTVYLENMSVNEKAKYYAQKDLFKTINILKGWISDQVEEEEE